MVEIKINMENVNMENSIQESRYAYKLKRCELYKTHLEIAHRIHKECDNDNSHSKNLAE